MTSCHHVRYGVSLIILLLDKSKALGFEVIISLLDTYIKHNGPHYQTPPYYHTPHYLTTKDHTPPYYHRPQYNRPHHTLLQGDSGSPLVVKSGPGQWSAVGLVSWRNKAGTPGGGCTGDTFTVFTEISRYLDWIARESDLLPPLS